jgi:hypothetical protein
MLRIELPGLPPKECSPNWRGHWAAKADEVKLYRHDTGWNAVFAKEAHYRLNQEWWLAPEHATMHVTFVVPDNRRRDKTNMAAAFKPALDGLVDAGIIKDDSHQCLDDQYHIEVRKGQRMTIVEVA